MNNQKAPTIFGIIAYLAEELDKKQRELNTLHTRYDDLLDQVMALEEERAHLLEELDK